MGRPARGHPPKRNTILEAGARVFLRHGYGRASMDEVAREGRVSKRTVYDQFASKEQLFRAIVSHVREEILESFSKADLADDDVEATLVAIGTRHLQTVTSPRVLELYRAVLAEVPRLPEPARIMFEAGLGRVVLEVTAYFARLKRKGVLDIADPARGAENLFGLLAGYPTTRLLMGVHSPTSPRALARQAKVAVRTFLDGVRRRPRRKPLR